MTSGSTAARMSGVILSGEFHEPVGYPALKQSVYVDGVADFWHARSQFTPAAQWTQRLRLVVFSRGS